MLTYVAYTYTHVHTCAICDVGYATIFSARRRPVRQDHTPADLQDIRRQLMSDALPDGCQTPA